MECIAGAVGDGYERADDQVAEGTVGDFFCIRRSISLCCGSKKTMTSSLVSSHGSSCLRRASSRHVRLDLSAELLVRPAPNNRRGPNATTATGHVAGGYISTAPHVGAVEKSPVAPSAGFEPATHGLGNRCSIP